MERYSQNRYEIWLKPKIDMLNGLTKANVKWKRENIVIKRAFRNRN